MRVDLKQAKDSLQQAAESLTALEDWHQNPIKEKMVEVIAAMDIKNGQLLWPLRVALSGKEFSPGAFEIAEALGKEEALRRLKVAIDKL